MYVDPMAMCRAEKFSNKHCVKYLGLPWNISMVAAMNNTSEVIVKEGLRANHSLVRQLQVPYAHSTNRDLNKRAEKLIAVVAGVPWSWRFVKFLEYTGDPSGYGVVDSRPQNKYKAHLDRERLPDTPENLRSWLLGYACSVNLRLDNARRGVSGETVLEAVQAYYRVYESFDKNKLRIQTSTINMTPPENPDLRIYHILERYITVLHLLPAEHIQEAVVRMLNHRGVEWLKHLPES